MVLDFDLNCTPVEESSSSILPQVSSPELNKEQFGSLIDVDMLDDDIQLLSSPPLVSQVRQQPRKNHGIAIDLEANTERLPVGTGSAIAESAATLLSFSGPCDHGRADEQPSTDLTLLFPGYVRTEAMMNLVHAQGSNFVGSKAPLSAPQPPLQEFPPPPPPKTDSIMNCPICLDSFLNPCSTACGHIFCEECIDASIKASVGQKKGRRCPNCRSKLPARKSYHRVYLPNMN